MPRSYRERLVHTQASAPVSPVSQPHPSTVAPRTSPETGSACLHPRGAGTQDDKYMGAKRLDRHEENKVETRQWGHRRHPRAR